MRDNILRESLKYVDDKGWTLDAIRAGSFLSVTSHCSIAPIRLGIQATQQPSTVEGLFSNGYDLVEYFIRDANAKMASHMSDKMQK